jgi:hypothetical protein
MIFMMGDLCRTNPKLAAGSGGSGAGAWLAGSVVHTVYMLRCPELPPYSNTFHHQQRCRRGVMAR